MSDCIGRVLKQYPIVTFQPIIVAYLLAHLDPDINLATIVNTSANAQNSLSAR